MEKENLSIEEILNEYAPCWYDEYEISWCARDNVIDAVKKHIANIENEIALNDKIINKQAELIKFYEDKLSIGEIHSSYQLKKDLLDLGQKI